MDFVSFYMCKYFHFISPKMYIIFPITRPAKKRERDGARKSTANPKML